MTVTPDANDVLFGSNKPGANFEQVGTTIGGVITAPGRSFQEREWNHQTQRSDGPPKTFPNSGDPIMGVALDVQTNQRDPSVQGDDGVRTVYIRGKRLKDAVREAVRSSGASRLEVGAEIWVTYTHDGPPPSSGSNPPKEWAVRYVPAASAAIGLGQHGQPQQQPYGQQSPQQGYQQPHTQQYVPPVQQQPQQGYQQPPAQAPAQQYTPPAQQAYAPPAQPQQPVHQQPAQQDAGGPTQEQIAGLLANRTDPRMVFPNVQLTPEQLAQIASFTQPQG